MKGRQWEGKPTNGLRVQYGIVVRTKLYKKFKSRPELILIFGHNWVVMVDFIVSSSGVVCREHAIFS